jgi:Rieske Fe-S protein
VRLTRREFLARAAAGGAAASALAVAPGCAPRIGPAPFVDVPAPVGGKLLLKVSSYPDLDREGGAIIARAPGVPPLLVARTPAGGFAAVSATCTHQGCPLGFEPWEVVCPCHLSRFGLDGQVHHPPARQGLATYGTEYDAGLDELAVDVQGGDPGFPPLAGGQVRLEFARFPDLLQPGGSASGRPQGYGRPILVVALAGGAYAAVDAVCPHLGCTVGYAPAEGDLACPCHGSRFTTEGALLAGPATSGLTAFAVSADAAGVTVDIPAP